MTYNKVNGYPSPRNWKPGAMAPHLVVGGVTPLDWSRPRDWEVPNRLRPGLPEHPYRASGSHQLDFSEFADVLYQQVVKPHSPRTIYLVDLRQETHGFFDGSAVSWYADNDFSNVGQPKEWITADEKARLGALAGRTTQVFSITADHEDNRKQERVMPVSFTNVSVRAAYTEADVAKMLTAKLETRVEHVRIPVTDHGPPSDALLAERRT